MRVGSRDRSGRDEVHCRQRRSDPEAGPQPVAHYRCTRPSLSDSRTRRPRPGSRRLRLASCKADGNGGNVRGVNRPPSGLGDPRTSPARGRDGRGGDLRLHPLAPGGRFQTQVLAARRRRDLTEARRMAGSSCSIPLIRTSRMRGSVDFNSPRPSIAAIRQSSRTSTVITRARIVASSGRPTLPRARHAWTRTTPSASPVAFNKRLARIPGTQLAERLADHGAGRHRLFPGLELPDRTRAASAFCCSLS